MSEALNIVFQKHFIGAVVKIGYGRGTTHFLVKFHISGITRAMLTKFG